MLCQGPSKIIVQTTGMIQRPNGSFAQLAENASWSVS